MTTQPSRAEVLNEAFLTDLMELHSNTSQGQWCKGATSHNTVAKKEGLPDYHVADFRHAKDASFVDAAHEFLPAMIAELRRLARVNAELVAALQTAKLELIRVPCSAAFEQDCPACLISEAIDAALTFAKEEQ